MRWARRAWDWVWAIERGPEVSLWELFDSQRDLARYLSGRDARVFYALFKSEGSHDLTLEHLDLTEGYVRLSIGGPRLAGDAHEARVEYEWQKGDDTCKSLQKGEVMGALRARYKDDVPERRQRVVLAGQDIVGYQVYL